MKANWVIYDHHLALQDGKNIYHPNASEICSLLAKENKLGICCENPTTDLPNIRFSKIGSSLHVKLSNNNGEIICNVVARRKGEYVPVDVLDGTIIDQCMSPL